MCLNTYTGAAAKFRWPALRHRTQLPIFSSCYQYYTESSIIHQCDNFNWSLLSCLPNKFQQHILVITYRLAIWWHFIYLHIFIEPTFQLDNIYICHLNFIYYLHFAWINQVCNGSISTEEECPRPVHGSVVRRPRRLHSGPRRYLRISEPRPWRRHPATGSSQSGFVFGDEEIRVVGYSNRERGNAIKINYLVSLQIIYTKPGWSTRPSSCSPSPSTFAASPSSTSRTSCPPVTVSSHLYSLHYRW